MRTTITNTGERRGFTLLELLVVLAILGTLMALIAAAVHRAGISHREALTASTIRKTRIIFERQYRAAIDNARQEADSNLPQTFIDLAGGSRQRGKILYVKYRLKQQFPMNYDEIYSPALFSTVPEYVNALGGSTGSNPRDLQAESSACLFIALTAVTRRGVEGESESFPANELMDTDKWNDGRVGDGVKEIVDAWGRPLAFFRWPSSNDELNPPSGSPQPPKRDTEDPEGLLSAQGWWLTPTNPAQFATDCHPVVENQSYNLRPVIVSAGRDGQLGLTFPYMGGGVFSGYAQDNIYSYRLK